MKRRNRLVPLVCGLAAALLVAGLPAVATPAATATASPALDPMKALAGAWEGTNKDGQKVTAAYALVSDGTAVLETLNMADGHGMITIYHTDGDRLMLTHYCGAGNQPRMRAEKAASRDTIRFAFVDATNLPSPQAGHMHSLVLKMDGPDSLNHTWTWKEGSKESQEIITLARKK